MFASKKWRRLVGSAWAIQPSRHMLSKGSSWSGIRVARCHAWGQVTKTVSRVRNAVAYTSSCRSGRIRSMVGSGVARGNGVGPCSSASTASAAAAGLVAQHTSVPRARPRTRRVAVEPGAIGVRSRFSSGGSKLENRDLTPDGVSRRERSTGARLAIASIAMSPLHCGSVRIVEEKLVAVEILDHEHSVAPLAVLDRNAAAFELGAQRVERCDGRLVRLGLDV